MLDLAPTPGCRSRRARASSKSSRIASGADNRLSAHQVAALSIWNAARGVTSVDFHVKLTRVFSARLTRYNDGNLLSGFECAPFKVGERCLEKPTRIGSVDRENQHKNPYQLAFKRWQRGESPAAFAWAHSRASCLLGCHLRAVYWTTPSRCPCPRPRRTRPGAYPVP